MRHITLVIHREADGWWAEAPELPGFSAAAATVDALREVARDGLAFHLDDEPFEVYEHTIDHTPKSLWNEIVTTSVGAAQGVARAIVVTGFKVDPGVAVRNAATGSPALTPALP